MGAYLKFRGQNLEYLSLIFLEAKFGAPTRIFRGKLWGQAPSPTSEYGSTPLGRRFTVYEDSSQLLFKESRLFH